MPLWKVTLTTVVERPNQGLALQIAKIRAALHQWDLFVTSCEEITEEEGGTEGPPRHGPCRNSRSSTTG